MKSIAVFCGAKMGNDPCYEQAAIELANAAYEKNLAIIYGGASVGLMNTLANQMLKLGGKVIGIYPRLLSAVEPPHKSLTELHIVDSFSERKKLMYELADGFITLPGGLGSMDELFEMLILSRFGSLPKPSAILNINHYYDLLLDFLNNMDNNGFLSESLPDHIISSENPRELIDAILNKC